MRRAIAWLTVLAATFFLGMTVGGFRQHLSSGYVYEVRNEQAYAWPSGKIRLIEATESVGVPLLDPGTFSIVLDEGWCEFVLYKAKRTFQESWPAVHDVAVSDDEVRWDDGCHSYSLHIGASQRGDRQRQHEPGK